MNGADPVILADYGNKTTGHCPVQCPYSGLAFIMYLHKIVSSAVSCLSCFLFSSSSSLLLSSENLWSTLHASIQVLTSSIFDGILSVPDGPLWSYHMLIQGFLMVTQIPSPWFPLEQC